jgi:hypothetical protein
MKLQGDVRQLIAGPSVFICDECVEVCNDIIADPRSRISTAGAGGALEPSANVNAQREATAQPGYLGSCALCRIPLTLEEATPIGERGFLCQPCTDAIAEELAHKMGAILRRQRQSQPPPAHDV